MKNFSLKLVLSVVVSSLAFSAFGQSFLEDPKWGADPEERQENALAYNIFRDAYNNKDYDDAVVNLQQLLEKAPKASENIYVYGLNIYKNKAARATSVAEKNSYIDSLVLLYDMRAEHFADDENRGRPYVLRMKAIDYLEYKAADRDNVRKYFQEAIAANGNTTESNFINIYFQELTSDYKADEVEMDEYMNEYEKLEAIMKSGQNDADEAAMNTFEALFVSSGAANCGNIENLYAKRVEENPTDVEMLGKVITLMTRANCKGDFYLQVAELYYQQDPSSNTALALAAGYEEKGEYVKALKYLEAAFSQETDPELKVNLAVRMASSELGNNNARGAADYARQALSINPDSGFATYILAQAYAVGANNCSGFDRSAAYWIVYDTLVKARTLMAGDTTIGDIDSQINGYRASFPTKEECFFRGLNDGEGYTVSCGWVSGRTTVRSR